jgi:hypothetical protein
LSLFDLYERWDYRRNVSEQDALRPTDLANELANLPTFSLPAQHLPQDLDILLNFTASTLPASILAAPRHGVWSFRHDLDFTRRHGKPHSWQALERNSVSGTILLALRTPHEQPHILARSYSSLEPTSLYRSRNPILWKSSEIALRRLRALAADPDSPPLPSPALDPPYRKPRNCETLLYFSRYLGRWLRSRTSRAAGPACKWCLAIRPRSAAMAFEDPSGFQTLVSPEDRFYADPFLFERDGKTFLFFEDFRYAEGRAVICCCELSGDGQPGPVTEVLRRPYHLSYPFVFEDNGEIYMLPETRSNRTVEIYRATHFPHTWVADTVLMHDVQIVDSTLHKSNGKYWLFASDSDGRFSNCDELSLFFADALRGPWHPHPANPLLSDVRRARPAGKLFLHNGRLIRPAQDCGKAYGYALVFAEIVTLTETAYEERIVSRLNPETIPHCTATHTYNRTARFEVVDRNLPPTLARASGQPFP